jgi:TRAP-type C4-dicarboxylate transport system permease large subunit
LKTLVFENGILTEQSISKLFAAGIFPGILLSILFLLVIYVRALKNPALAPPGPKTNLKEN